MFFVYILQNPKGRFYIGHTDNLDARVTSHNRIDKISGKFTRKMGHGFWYGRKNIRIAQALYDASARSNHGNLRA